jgi:site-specific DNA-methyltransferase (adenine-specific)
MQFMDIKNGRFYLGDCLEVMKEIPDGVVDMLLVDLPYGTTACSWDSIIPLDELWKEYNRICKENAAMVFTAAQPFTTALIASNIDNFRYDWIWVKNGVTNVGNAKKMPLRNYESVVVFYRKPCLYNPQGLKPFNKVVNKGKSAGGATTQGDEIGNGRGKLRSGEDYLQEWTNYPRQTLEIKQNSRNKIHPTQKPVELFEYLIRTYTNEGDLVLDNTAGSGTTAIAAENTGRKWVCIEQSEEYATKAVERILNREVKPQESTSVVQIDSGIPIPEGEENGN